MPRWPLTRPYAFTSYFPVAKMSTFGRGLRGQPDEKSVQTYDFR
jgi:hypothetical protein